MNIKLNKKCVKTLTKSEKELKELVTAQVAGGYLGTFMECFSRNGGCRTMPGDC
ncbi:MULTISPECIES: hypothetical protein [Pseudoalteromonas]|uniref:hypothetical protein n=1 Tax=Pseudoalteromonas TaxID=53246 RepID=UPI001486F146|nr:MULTISPECIES: hypothetical protein [Pseudoalteromonas]